MLIVGKDSLGMFSNTITSLFFLTGLLPKALVMCPLQKRWGEFMVFLFGSKGAKTEQKPELDCEMNGKTEGLLQGKWNYYHEMRTQPKDRKDETRSFASLRHAVSAFSEPLRPCGIVSCTVWALQISALSLFKSPSCFNFERHQTPRIVFKATDHHSYSSPRDTGLQKVTWKASAMPPGSHGWGDGSTHPVCQKVTVLDQGTNSGKRDPKNGNWAYN